MAAEMRAAADHQAAEAGLIAALHALILATLARLFNRLENMVALWAAGALPVLPPRQPNAARAHAQAESQQARTARSPRRTRPHQAPPQEASPSAAGLPAPRQARRITHPACPPRHHAGALPHAPRTLPFARAGPIFP